jgi:hypothetical protein
VPQWPNFKKVKTGVLPVTQHARSGNVNKLIGVIPAKTLAAAFAGQSLLHALLFTGLQIERMLLDFLDNVFRLNSPLEAAQGVFQGLSILETNFCQINYTSSQMG